MINGEKIVFNEPLYYAPDYSGIIRISILRLLDDGRALVKQSSKKKDLKPFPMQLAHIYNSDGAAAKGRRAWESYQRKNKKASKAVKKDAT